MKWWSASMAGQEVEFCARFIPELGDPADQVAGFRVERPGLKPSQELLNGCVAHLAR